MVSSDFLSLLKPGSPEHPYGTCKLAFGIEDGILRASNQLIADWYLFLNLTQQTRRDRRANRNSK